ncbi:hypothetical protein [Myceligenerans crystallogenes]|uniref:DUF4192 domain-containing protein n=1 Tax=Myceligenerans crystallogenes TaxID=316335 RepID=A0ABN2N749_9MICO
MDTSRDQIGDYLAKIPFTVGHEIADEQVVVGAVQANRQDIVHIVLDWDDTVHAQRIADQVTRILAGTEPPASLIVVGFGPHGRARAGTLADGLRATMPSLVMPVHVHDGVWRALEGKWTHGQPVPDLTAELVVAGFPIPAGSPADLEASVAPLRVPAFDPLDDQTADRLAALAPRQRAGLAQDVLERVADGGPDEIGQMRVLAHLATTDLVIRDVILAYTLDGGVRHDRVEALVRTFRAAPARQQPLLATLAAAATYFACWHTPKTVGLLRHADPIARLTHLVQSALESNFDPRQAHDTVRDGAVEGLQRQEQEHDARRAAADDLSTGPVNDSGVRAGPVQPPAHPRVGTYQNGPSL